MGLTLWQINTYGKTTYTFIRYKWAMFYSYVSYVRCRLPEFYFPDFPSDVQAAERWRCFRPNNTPTDALRVATRFLGHVDVGGGFFSMLLVMTTGSSSGHFYVSISWKTIYWRDCGSSWSYWRIWERWSSSSRRSLVVPSVSPGLAVKNAADATDFSFAS